MILLDRVDADEVFDFVAVAAVLAGRRAHAAHHGREGVGIGGAAEGVLLPRHPDRRLLLLRTMASQPRMSSPEGQVPWQGGVLCT